MGAQDILAVGELLWDLLPSGPRLGGTNANFAMACARLGHRSALVSCVGTDDLGDSARAVLARQSAGSAFDLTLLQSTAALPTGTVDVLLGPGGQPQYVISAPAAWDRIDATPEALDRAGSAAAICFGTLAQRDQSSCASIRRLVQEAQSAVRVFDVNVRLPFCTPEVVQWSLRHADLVKISDEELALVLAMLDISESPLPTPASDLWPIEDLEQAARAVLAFAPACRLIAITLGARGSLLVSRDALDHHPGFAIEVEDTVGAGDAFTAGMTHAYLHGGSLAAINQVGNLCGGYVATQPGAMPPYPQHLLDRIEAALPPTIRKDL